jgi:predicted nucleic acid-binding protein
MSESVDFLDANVLLYGLDADAPEDKRLISQTLVGRALAKQTAVISWQIVREMLNVASHKFKTSITTTTVGI